MVFIKNEKDLCATKYSEAIKIFMTIFGIHDHCPVEKVCQNQ